MTKEELIQKYTRADGRWNSALLRRIPPEELNLLFSLTPQFKDSEPNLAVRLHVLKHGIESVSCPSCNKIQTKLNDRGEIGTLCRPCFDKSPLKKESMKSRNYKEAKKKRSATMLSKYGVEFNSQREDVKAILGAHCKLDSFKEAASIRGRSQFPAIRREMLENIEWVVEQNRTKTTVEIAHELSCSPAAVQQVMRKHGHYANPALTEITSKEEIAIESLLQELDVGYAKHERTIIHPKELDFYIPEHNLAIEINGVYWHGELKGRGQFYHLQKTEACHEKGIRLLQFWDSEVKEQLPIIESMIKSRLGLSGQIPARKCSVVIPTQEQESWFFTENHRQGYAKSSSSVGLEYQGEIVAMMSFSKSRFNREYDWELLRFASKLGYMIVGGASKLFNHASIKGSIISYADKRYSSGLVYKKLGFSWKSDSKPGFWYTKNHQRLYHRSKFQKHKLEKILEHFNPSLSEWENMKANGYDRVWDCGQSVWVREND